MGEDEVVLVAVGERVVWREVSSMHLHHLRASSTRSRAGLSQQTQFIVAGRHFPCISQVPMFLLLLLLLLLSLPGIRVVCS